ncbi:MAG: ABC transporter ATP-binding protein [Bacillota bacterium]|nr:ABC transporter ATP-binding protein [Bacillota bacterium]
MEKENNSRIVLKVSELVKKFGTFTAVNKLSFEVNKGEIFGFLGPNGAGKTTSINMICGLIKPDYGDVLINGESINNGKVRQMIGLCPQDINVWETLTCLEQLIFMGQMYDMDGRKAKKRGLELLEEFGLTEKRNKLAATLSGGMQRRLNIALALIHEPEILILDEPQAGLDPQSRVLVRDYIRTIAKQVTVVLTTHDMDEAERLSDRVGIIDHGEMLVIDTPDNLKNSIYNGDIIELQISNNNETNIKQALLKLPQKISSKFYMDGVITIASNDILGIIPEILSSLKDSAIKVNDIQMRKRTLEDVFISMTGRGLRE